MSLLTSILFSREVFTFDSNHWLLRCILIGYNDKQLQIVRESSNLAISKQTGILCNLIWWTKADISIGKYSSIACM